MDFIICFAGYYCPEGQTVRNPSAFLCPKGYYCLEGSAEPTICPSGTYQDEIMTYDCKECPAGFYCDNSIEPVVNATAYECPQGEICRTFFHLKFNVIDLWRVFNMASTMYM